MIPHDTIAGIIFVGGILAVLILSEILHRKFSVPADATRKLVHVAVGLLAASAPWIFYTPTIPFVIGCVFTVGNFWFVRRDLLSSIHRHETYNFGTVFFPLAFIIIIALFWYKPPVYLSAMLMMTLSDPMAGSLGKKMKRPHIYRIWQETKSLEGSLVMFLSSFFITAGTLFYFSQFQQLLYPLHAGIIFGISGLVALTATLAEGTSRNGSDNLSVPVVTALILDILMIQWNHGYFYPLVLWIAFSTIVFLLIFRWGWLSPDGTVGAWFMGLLIVGSQSWIWVLYLFLFMVSATLLGKIRSRRNNRFQPSAPRTIAQVYANGFIPLLIALAAFYLQSEKGIILYLAAISAATSDTWATEFGLRSKRSPHNILTGRNVLPGQSGGVTWFGLWGSLLGAVFIAFFGLLITRDLLTLGLIVIAGFAGALLDSVLGASLQAQYRCRICSRATEDSLHCDTKAERISGWPWINNDIVNLINTLTGAVLLYFWI